MFMSLKDKKIKVSGYDSKINIQYYNEPKKGIPFARNKGVELIKDDYNLVLNQKQTP